MLFRKLGRCLHERVRERSGSERETENGELDGVNRVRREAQERRDVGVEDRGLDQIGHAVHVGWRRRGILKSNLGDIEHLRFYSDTGTGSTLSRSMTRDDRVPSGRSLRSRKIEGS